MTEMMSHVENAEDSTPTAEPTGRDGLDQQLINQLVDRAKTGELQLTGEGGVLQQLTKRLLESALDGEITDHLGYDRHDPAGRNTGNSRNGTRTKTVLTDVGPVEITVPRDREGSFEPKIVAKRQKRLTGVDEMVISLAAKGLTTGEIRRVICSTNAIESVNARIRRAVKARGHFPNEQAALKCVYMAVMSLDPTGSGRKRWMMRWKPALNAFEIAFDGRLAAGRK